MRYFLKNKLILFPSLFVLFIIAVFYSAFSNWSINDVNINYNNFAKEIVNLTNGVDYSVVDLSIGGNIIKTEVVFSREAQYKGLSNREEISEKEGMLFVFNDDSQKTFLMRDMLFPLDIIFLENGRIRKIYSNLEPEGPNPNNKYVYGPADVVLELRAGTSEKFGIKEGMWFNISY